jgi:cellulose synthase/poly-beta-1,6-N-acetylglucosamine synthase-like glycosyltransferase
METLFWTSVLIVAYVYLGYPLLLGFWAAVAARPVGKQRPHADSWPLVSVVVAVHDEAPRLPGRLSNLLEQDYPRPLDIIVVSDGSSDNPRQSITLFSQRVRLIELPRVGKAQALNEGVEAARGDFVVFADARQRFAPDAVSELISNFSDPNVGAVTGELVLDCEARPEDVDSTLADGVGLYWKYEKWLRRRESRIASTVGATGAIYAVRRGLWRPLPDETVLDDVLTPMRIVLGGRRVIFDERARAFDRVVADAAAERRRKTRTLAGNYQLLALEPRVLSPLRNPVWWQFVSHKLGRLLVPWALVGALVASAVLAGGSWFYRLALIVQLGFYGLAAVGGLMERTRVGSADESDRADKPGHADGREDGLPQISGGRRVKAG